MSEFQKLFSLPKTDDIAKQLLGVELVYKNPKGTVSGFIVETEAYFGTTDSSSYAYKGKRDTENEPLYGPSGTIFIYKMYGSYMLDVVTQPIGNPEGIILRAVQPNQGASILKRNRPIDGIKQTNGPGKFTQAFGISSMELNGSSYLDSQIQLDFSQRLIPQNILVLPRRGAADFDKKYRFAVDGNPYVSTVKNKQIDKVNLGWKKETTLL